MMRMKKGNRSSEQKFDQKYEGFVGPGDPFISNRTCLPLHVGVVRVVLHIPFILLAVPPKLFAIWGVPPKLYLLLGKPIYKLTHGGTYFSSKINTGFSL